MVRTSAPDPCTEWRSPAPRLASRPKGLWKAGEETSVGWPPPCVEFIWLRWTYHNLDRWKGVCSGRGWVTSQKGGKEKERRKERKKRGRKRKEERGKREREEGREGGRKGGKKSEKREGREGGQEAGGTWPRGAPESSSDLPQNHTHFQDRVRG